MESGMERKGEGREKMRTRVGETEEEGEKEEERRNRKGERGEKATKEEEWWIMKGDQLGDEKRKKINKWDNKKNDEII